METVIAPRSTLLDLDRLLEMPVNQDPYEHVIVPEFIRADALPGIHEDYPEISKPGSFPLSTVKCGPRFQSLVDEMNGPEFRAAVESKFKVDLVNRPTMMTVRGQCRERDGKIHTDSATKIITVLLYLNENWEAQGGQLRLLRSGIDLEDYAVEVPPTEGTLLVFRRSEKSWHGHKPFEGTRRVIQFNWVTSEDVVRRETSRHRFSAFGKRIRTIFNWL